MATRQQYVEILKEIELHMTSWSSFLVYFDLPQATPKFSSSMDGLCFSEMWRELEANGRVSPNNLYELQRFLQALGIFPQIVRKIDGLAGRSAPQDAVRAASGSQLPLAATRSAASPTVEDRAAFVPARTSVGVPMQYGGKDKIGCGDGLAEMQFWMKVENQIVDWQPLCRHMGCPPYMKGLDVWGRMKMQGRRYSELLPYFDKNDMPEAAELVRQYVS